MWRAMEGRLGVPEDPCHGLGVHVQEKRWSRPGSKPTHSGHSPHKIFDPPNLPKKWHLGRGGGGGQNQKILLPYPDSTSPPHCLEPSLRLTKNPNCVFLSACLLARMTV